MLFFVLYKLETVTLLSKTNSYQRFPKQKGNFISKAFPQIVLSVPRLGSDLCSRPMPAKDTALLASG